jgi:hypothetical protein
VSFDVMEASAKAYVRALNNAANAADGPLAQHSAGAHARKESRPDGGAGSASAGEQTSPSKKKGAR